jgi:hypothetical protein
MTSLLWRGVTSLGGEQGSGLPKPRREASCQGLHGTGVVIAVSLTILLGHRAVPHNINVFHPYGALLVVTDCSPFLMGQEWNMGNKG